MSANMNFSCFAVAYKFLKTFHATVFVLKDLYKLAMSQVAYKERKNIVIIKN